MRVCSTMMAVLFLLAPLPSIAEVRLVDPSKVTILATGFRFSEEGVIFTVDIENRSEIPICFLTAPITYAGATLIDEETGYAIEPGYTYDTFEFNSFSTPPELGKRTKLKPGTDMQFQVPFDKVGRPYLFDISKNTGVTEYRTRKGVLVEIELTIIDCKFHNLHDGVRAGQHQEIRSERQLLKGNFAPLWIDDPAKW